MTVLDSTEAEAAVFELFVNRSGRVDPYPLYHRLRTAGPVHQSSFGPWFVSSYAEASTVLRDNHFGRISIDAQEQFDPRLLGSRLLDTRTRNMLFVDPPDHTRLRRLVSKAFTPNAVERLRPYVRSFVDSVLDRAEADGRLDVIDDLAFPLPVTVIGEMLGIPEEDRDQFRAWTHALVATLEPLLSDEVLAAADASLVASNGYLHDLVARRRTDRGPDRGADLLSEMIAAEEEGDRLTEDEIVVNANLLVSAGFETTMNLVGNAVLALLRHPDQLDRLRREPELIRTAVEEFLRYDGSVQFAPPRMAQADIQLGEQVIPQGDVVVALLGAANRDPAAFDDPDRLDIGRPDVKPLTFGGGIHFCLGAALARLEAVEAVGGLVQRFSRLELQVDEPEWHPTINLRGLVSLPVEVARAGA